MMRWEYAYDWQELPSRRASQERSGAGNGRASLRMREAPLLCSALCRVFRREKGIIP